MIWDDVKKLGNLILEQTKEQKDIALLKLRQISYENKKDDAFSRLGQRVYELVKAGKNIDPADGKIRSLVEEVDSVSGEIANAGNLIKELKVRAEKDRGSMSNEAASVWNKTKKAFDSVQKKGAKDADAKSGEPGTIYDREKAGKSGAKADKQEPGANKSAKKKQG